MSSFSTQPLIDWMSRLIEESKQVRINMMKFLSDYRVRICNGKAFTQCVIDKGSITSSYKLLESIKLSNFKDYPLLITDGITQRNANIIDGDITAFKET